MIRPSTYPFALKSLISTNLQISDFDKGTVKLIERVEKAHSFLHSVSNQFHVIILSLPMYFYKWL